MFHEYVRLNNAQSDVVKPYGRPEFEKWLKGFDVSIHGFIGDYAGADERLRPFARFQAIREAYLSWMPTLTTPMSNSS